VTRWPVVAVAALVASACGTQDGLHVENGGSTVTPPSRTVTPPPSSSAKPHTRDLALGGPAAIAYADGTLWCAVRPAGGRLVGSLVQVDTASGRVTGAPEPLPVSDHPYLLAVVGGNVWVGGGDRLWRIDPATGAVAATVQLEGRLTALTPGLGDLWATVVSPSRGRLLRLDASSGDLIADARVGPAPSALTVVPRQVWVTDAQRQTVTRFDVRRGVITRGAAVALPLSDRRAPTQVTAYAGLVWVYERGRVIRIDPATATVVGTSTVAPAAGGTIAAGSGGIWVITQTRRYNHGAVRLLDGRSGLGIGRRITIGGHPAAMATDGRSLWVVDATTGRLIRVTRGED
jgi:DNA-binding beta-propeller fold protein YncE